MKINSQFIWTFAIAVAANIAATVLYESWKKNNV